MGNLEFIAGDLEGADLDACKGLVSVRVIAACPDKLLFCLIGIENAIPTATFMVTGPEAQSGLRLDRRGERRCGYVGRYGHCWLLACFRLARRLLCGQKTLRGG